MSERLEYLIKLIITLFFDVYQTLIRQEKCCTYCLKTLFIFQHWNWSRLNNFIMLLFRRCNWSQQFKWSQKNILKKKKSTSPIYTIPFVHPFLYISLLFLLSWHKLTYHKNRLYPWLLKTKPAFWRSWGMHFADWEQRYIEAVVTLGFYTILIKCILSSSLPPPSSPQICTCTSLICQHCYTHHCSLAEIWSVG